MTNYKNPAPVHYAFDGMSSRLNNSPCGISNLWDRSLSYTRVPSRVSCRHCRHWLAKNPEVKVAS